ncbi:MAG: DNA polymerase III subunit alpha [Planctomycetota bacterium]|nr:MAG: DNA polymerase III subunit alpha [Planctomycetota bacterium]
MSGSDFAHLHVHTEYSLLDGANRIGALVDACKKDGQRAIAITDHGNLFGAIEFYQACTKGGIKPILGCEVYVAKKSRLEKHSKVDNGYSHLTLLARDAQGWRNLLELASISYLEGYNYRPRVDMEALRSRASGITCLSGCLAGEINQLFRLDKESEAEKLAGELRDLFGPEHFWLELQRNGIELQNKVNEDLVRLAGRTGIPLVATNDIHYLRHEDCHVQDVLICINTGAKRADEKRWRMDTDSLFFRTGEEMAHMFRDLPKTVTATCDIADQVDVKLDFGKYHLPVFDTGTSESADQLFDRLCEEGLRKFYGAEHAKARERLEYERGVIRQMGFVSYFLIVWDLIRWARDHSISVGPGRGSAAGSLIAYVLGITQVDPLRYDLLFERFLNSSRISMPDIDIDFCKEGRERVLQYTRERYGSDRVTQIVTFGTMAARTALRDVGRVLEVPLAEVDKIAKLVPQGPGAKELAELAESDADLVKVRKERPDLADLFKYSIQLEGIARHISTHAAGVVIADRKLTEYVPLATHDGEVVTQWPGPQLEQLGLLKMDYLGLRTLTILDRALASLKLAGTAVPDLLKLPEDDALTFRMLAQGDTLGVFQLESDGMKKLLARLKPTRFEDLIAVLALYRPGPLESGMVEMFIRRKHGLEPISYEHPSMEPILRDTYGCIVYQEQVMLISSALSGFSLNEADNLRKAMGKKQPEVMQKFASKFVEGAMKNGCARDVAQQIWDNIEKFGGYGFNKSHSTAYALITWQTAWLKANHRREFLAANMSCEMHDSDKIKAFVDDAKAASIAILAPDIAASGWEFRPTPPGIRFGLGAIKGTGEKAIEALVATRARMDGVPTLHRLCKEVDAQEMTRLTWEALIKAGCFDAQGHDRGALLAALDAALSDGQRAADDRRAGQSSFFDLLEPASAADADGIDATKAWSRSERLKAEYEVLGYYLSGHPLEERAGLFSILSTCTTGQLQQRGGQAEVVLAGLVRGLREAVVKTGTLAGQKMARAQLEDLEGSAALTFFPRTWERFRAVVADDAVVIVKGKVDDRSEGAAMLVDEVWTLEQTLKRFEGSVWIYVTPEDEGLIERLFEVLGKHRGGRPVYLQVLGADGRVRPVRADAKHAVALTAELARDVDALLGRGRMRLARG